MLQVILLLLKHEEMVIRLNTDQTTRVTTEAHPVIKYTCTCTCTYNYTCIHGYTVWFTYTRAKERRLLDHGLPGPRFLAGDLVEGEEEMMLLCDLWWQLYLDLFVELWLPLGGREGGREGMRKRSSEGGREVVRKRGRE